MTFSRSETMAVGLAGRSRTVGVDRQEAPFWGHPSARCGKSSVARGNAQSPQGAFRHRRLTDFLGAATLDGIPKGDMMASCHAALTTDGYPIALQGGYKPLKMLALLDRLVVELGPKVKAA